MASGEAQLPYSQSCENNKDCILAVLREAFVGRSAVLEIGSGTAQHASWFAAHMPWLNWQPTEVPANIAFTYPRCAGYDGDNLAEPLPLDVTQRPWPVNVPDAIFTANTLHIMPFSAVQQLFDALAEQAPDDALLAVYGPFNYNGQYTSESNARFDVWLAQQHPQSAIRDFERVDSLARQAGFVLQDDYEMPANNRLLLWRKSA